MRDPKKAAGQYEKAAAGWFKGVDSSGLPWLIGDDQAQWAKNMVFRGGLPQCRPGYRLQITCPDGNFQGMVYFKSNYATANSTPTVVEYLVFAVNGIVYYVAFNSDGTLTQPINWQDQQIYGVQFDPDVERIYFCVATSSVNASQIGTLSVTQSYNLLMMQDGTNPAGSWDGVNAGKLYVESAPTLGTPTGTWMAFAGNRLWVARGSNLLASDLLNPGSFAERITGATAGTDYQVDDVISAMTPSLDQNRQTDLVVWTQNITYAFQSSILDRTTWGTTANFQSQLYPTVGCSAGLSVINHAGLLWWYTNGGLVNSDSAAAAYLTSKISYRDIEMARSKVNFSPDISGICSASFENYLMVSVPSGDTFNAHTMVLDYSPADKLTGALSPPAWNGVWTGTRPIQWATGVINGQKRCFQASKDYQSYGNSFNHIWEAFQDDRSDSYFQIDETNTQQLVRNSIYWEFETKELGDSMELKSFDFAEIDFVEIGGIVNVKCGYASNKGSYHTCMTKQIVAIIDPAQGQSAQLNQLFAQIGQARVQSRRVYTAHLTKVTQTSVESEWNDRIGKAHSLLIQGCGRAGIESLRFITNPQPEQADGRAEVNETSYNVLTYDGLSFEFPNPQAPVDPNAVGANITAGLYPQRTSNLGNLNNQQEDFSNVFISPFTPRYKEVFYSSIPVSWSDLANCIVCLPCARDTFSPPDGAAITINGVLVS